MTAPGRELIVNIGDGIDELAGVGEPSRPVRQGHYLWRSQSGHDDAVRRFVVVSARF
jgi:hypothetical protein